MHANTDINITSFSLFNRSMTHYDEDKSIDYLIEFECDGDINEIEKRFAGKFGAISTDDCCFSIDKNDAENTMTLRFTVRHEDGGKVKPLDFKDPEFNKFMEKFLTSGDDINRRMTLGSKADVDQEINNRRYTSDAFTIIETHQKEWLKEFFKLAEQEYQTKNQPEKKDKIKNLKNLGARRLILLSIYYWFCSAFSSLTQEKDFSKKYDSMFTEIEKIANEYVMKDGALSYDIKNVVAQNRIIIDGANGVNLDKQENIYI